MTTGTQGRIYDELAKLMNDAAGLAQSAGREVSSAFRSQGERLASELDLVRREDLETVQEIATRALAEVERLSARVTELETRLSHTEAEVETTDAP
ncbi:MAG: membrane fusogenic activity protein [Proteobacteria bacterium]|nr:membrane fusogenic activity protein [Pseudomonadota bacterium]